MRLSAPTSLLCVVDIQERLLPAIPAGPQVVAMAGRLADAATLLGVRRVLTEQYPRGLGPTPPDLAAQDDVQLLRQRRLRGDHRGRR